MELAPGDPPNALLRFASSESLRADLCIRANKAIYSVAPERKLEPGTRIMLHVQLPNGAFIQMKGKVSSSDTTACVIEARSLPLATLHALEAALLAG